MDWDTWSRESVSLMMGRNSELFARHGLATGSAYRWNLETGTMVIGDLTFWLTTVGTVVGDSFLWAWANDAIPPSGKTGIERVREFGLEHDLALLVEECQPGGLAQAKECLAIAGRILNASATWIDKTSDGFIAFVLREQG